MTLPDALRPGPYRSRHSAMRTLARRFGAPSVRALSAMVEIADRCNEACVHCYQLHGQKGELTTAELEAVFDELASLGVLLLTISGGEPTLRKDFLHLVAYARRLRFAVKIYSNGLNITRELAQALGRLAVQEVQLSLYSDRADVHDQVTRVPGSFEKTVAAVRHLREAGVRVVLKTPLMRSNVDRVREYAAFVTGLGAEYSLDPDLCPKEDGDPEPRKLGLERAAYVNVRRTLPSLPTRDPPQLSDRPCSACSRNVHVEANGELRPCSLWSVPTGHAPSEGVAAAWSSNPTALAIRTLSWETLPACRQCDLRGYCNRCFAQAQMEVGDALAPYVGACRRARWEYEVRHGQEPVIEALEGSGAVGPYRHTSQHHFVRTDYHLDDADRDRSQQYPWLADPRRAAPGQLVQLRRSKRGTLT